MPNFKTMGLKVSALGPEEVIPLVILLHGQVGELLI